jgi:hypothetical protein
MREAVVEGLYAQNPLQQSMFLVHFVRSPVHAPGMIRTSRGGAQMPIIGFFAAR